jgi:hypothetical protein
MVEYATKNICGSDRQGSLPPNGRVTSGRIFRSERKMCEVGGLAAWRPGGVKLAAWRPNGLAA